MKAFRFHEKFFTVVGMCAPPMDTTKFRKCVYRTTHLALLSHAIFGLTASVAFLVLYASSDIKSALAALIPIGALSSAVFKLIFSMIFRSEIRKLFEKLQKFYDESK